MRSEEGMRGARRVQLRMRRLTMKFFKTFRGIGEVGRKESRLARQAESVGRQQRVISGPIATF